MRDTEESRLNLVDRRAEAWRPPSLAAPGRIRRFLDLQVASIWNDIRPVLAAATGTVVDAGCGGQPFRELVGPAARYVGLDTAEAAERFGYGQPDTLIIDGNRWPLDDASVDLVLCTETLEHVLEPSVLLDEAFRCLRPGGTLLLTTPFAARWHFVPFDYWRFTPSSLAHVLGRSGFTAVHVRARGNALTVACLKIVGLVAPLLLAPGRSLLRTGARRIAGLLTLPIAVVALGVGHLSLRAQGGDDCLGYTTSATRPS
ncbi:MAG: class I SAM-dependent methyltransferase [Gaiellaceae bacterium]